MIKIKTAIEKEESKNAISMQREILTNCQDINNVLTSAQNVSPLFHSHYVNMDTAAHGIENLIAEILTAREAVFPKGIEHTEFKKVAIAASMFASEIEKEVEARFTAGSCRYPYETIHQYLSVFMFRKGKVGKIKLSGIEDQPRPCCKPRCKWYLINQ